MKYTTRRKAMFCVLSLGYMLVFLHGVIMTVFAKELMRDMRLSPAGMGMLGSSYLYAYAAMMLVSGLVAVWAGPRATLSILFATSGLGGLVFAFSDTLWVAMLGRALSGLGMAATMTSSFTLFARWYAPDAYSRICSYFFAMGGMGLLLGISLAPVLNAAVGWRMVFGGIAVLTLVYATLILILVRDWPPSDADITSASRRITRGDTTVASMWYGIREMAKSGDFWRIAIWFGSLPGIYFAFNGLWAIPYFKDVYGISDAEAGLMVSLGGIGFTLGSPFASWLTDRVWKSYRISIAGSAVFSTLSVAYLLLRIDTMGKVALYVLLIAFGMFLNSTNACAHASSRSLFGSRMAGITGGAYGCSAFLGGALAQVICGELLTYAQNRQWDAAESYLLAFTPLIVFGLVGIWVSCTLSSKADAELRCGK